MCWTDVHISLKKDFKNRFEKDKLVCECRKVLPKWNIFTSQSQIVITIFQRDWPKRGSCSKPTFILDAGYPVIIMFYYRIFTEVYTLRPRQNRLLFSRRHFQIHFLNENVLISIKISLKFVPKCPINSIPILVLIMAWWRPGHKPLSGPIMV